jgi:hypothetical protein
MVGKTKPATPAEREHMAIIKEYCGCLPCLLEDRYDVHATIQHVTECRKRVGQWAVYGACKWHHLGEPHPGREVDWMLFHTGPSLFHNKKLFVETYGGERSLVQVQDYMVGLHYLEPWQPHFVPVSAIRKVKAFWVKLQTGQTN